MATVDSGKND